MEARFDVGKTLTSLGGSVSGEGGKGIPNAAQKLGLVQQIHVLRTLKESDQFIWTNKLRTSPPPGLVVDMLFMLTNSVFAHIPLHSPQILRHHQYSCAAVDTS